MQVNVEIPDRSSDLEQALNKQFASIQKQLLRFMESQQKQAKSSRKEMLQAFSSQQDSLMKALMKMTTTMGKMPKGSSSELVRAVGSLKQAVRAMPKTLKVNQRPIQVRPQMKAPKVTVRISNNLSRQMSDLEKALASSSKSRNRTFGSNY